MITIICLVLSIIMILGAVAALYMRCLVSAIVTAGVVSLTASVLFLLFSAPDVAMTEAAIGSGLTTIVFLYALKKSGLSDRCEGGDE